MHVDMDAFFAAIEQRDHPELRGKPVIVGALPGGRGVVSTCSYEARRFGIHSAMPIGEAHRRCPDGIFLRPDFSRYIEASRKLMDVLTTISPVVEPVGIDEAYVDITGLGRLIGTPEEVGLAAKQRIFETLQVTASAGIAPNRAIAKIASDQHKPDGLTVVTRECVMAFLAPLPVTALRGLGEQTRAVLARVGVRTVRDMQQLTLNELREWLGKKHAVSLYRQMRGETSDVVGVGAARKSISKERTFQEDISSTDRLREVMLSLASDVGRIARREGAWGRVVTVKLRLRGFETHTKQRRLARATRADLDIFKESWALYENTPWFGRPLRLMGLGISDLVTSAGRGLEALLSRGTEERSERIYEVMDQLATRYGNGTLRFAGGAPIRNSLDGPDEE